MPKSSLEPESGSARPTAAAGAGAGSGANLASVLVVGRSQITCVVVSKIVERSGLRPVSESPDKAHETLSALRPGTVILDGGADNRECDHLFASLSAQREISGRNVPTVILLSTRIATPRDVGHASVVDAVVAKPITPEALQPVVDRLLSAVRH